MAISVLPAVASSMMSLDRADALSCFDQLVQDIKQVLGPSSGLTSDDVDVSHLKRLMEHYDGRDEGWMPYYFGDASRGYTRNLVDEGNGKSNLVSPPTRL